MSWSNLSLDEQSRVVIAGVYLPNEMLVHCSAHQYFNTFKLQIITYKLLVCNLIFIE